MKNKLVFEKEYLSKRKKPSNLQDKDLILFQHEFQKKINNSYGFNTSNVYIKEYKLYKFQKFITLTKYTNMIEFSNRKKIKTFIKNIFTKNHKTNKSVIKRGLWILDEKSFHYFHWFCDSLPRFIQAKNVNNKYPILLPKSIENIDYIKKSIDILEINYITYNDQENTKVKDLFVSSHSAPSGNYNNKTINSLAKSLKSNKKIEADNDYRNIWISRSKSKHRKIKNESEILPLLNRFNFKIIHPEEYTFEEQISIYKNANILGGLHGGGLTNILFMNEGTKLLEVRRENDDLNNCYYTLASELGINYYYVNSKSQGEDLYVSDTIINLSDLEKILIKITS